MKILYIHQYFNTPTMVGSTRSYEMAIRFVSKGNEVHIITTNRDEISSKKTIETVEDGIYVHWLPVPYSNNMSNFQRIIAFIKFVFRAYKASIKIGGDIIFATSTPLTVAIPSVFASKILKIPMVFEVRDLWPKVPIEMKEFTFPPLKWISRWLERFAYRNSKHIIALSPGMKNGIIETGVDPKKVTVIPNSCDIKLFSVDNSEGLKFREKNSWIGTSPLIIYCGTLGKVNGLSFMVDIASHSKEINPDLKFLIIGEGREKKMVIERAEEKGVLNQNLYILDSIPKNELPSVMNAATLTSSFVINNKVLWDNSANKFFDSLAAGKPIMINHEGWQADILRDSGAGIVVPPDNPVEAARILNDFISDNDKQIKFSEAAKKLASEKFDRDKLAYQLLEVLLNVKETSVK